MSDSFNKGRGLKSTVTGKAARNDVTGALIKTKPASDAYRNSPFWDSLEKDEDAEAPVKKDPQPPVKGGGTIPLFTKGIGYV